MGSPSIFVYDCSNAGLIVKSFKQFALQREQELEVRPSRPRRVSAAGRGACGGGGWTLRRAPLVLPLGGLSQRSGQRGTFHDRAREVLGTNLRAYF